MNNLNQRNMNKLPDSKSFRNNWTIPENYFEDLEQQILSRKGIKKKNYILKPRMVAAAALFIISIGSITWFNLKNQSKETPEEVYFSSDWMESADLNPIAYSSEIESPTDYLELSEEQLDEYILGNTDLVDLIEN